MNLFIYVTEVPEEGFLVARLLLGAKVTPLPWQKGSMENLIEENFNMQADSIIRSNYPIETVRNSVRQEIRISYY